MCTSQNSLVLVHQNVRGIISKTGELQEFFSNNKIYPHILCFTENHMSRNDVLSVGIKKYVLGSCFSQSKLQKGGVCVCVCVCLYIYIFIYICNDVYFNHLDFSNYCKEKILEICAVQIETKDK